MAAIPPKAEVSKELIALDSPLENFSAPVTMEEEGGLDKVILAIREKVFSIPQDLTTEKGREAVKSTRHKIRRSKTYLKEQIKAYADTFRAKGKTIDAQSEKMQNELDALIEEMSKPLNEFEEREAKRVTKLQNGLAMIEEHSRIPLTSTQDEIRQRIADLLADDGVDWMEFETKVKAAKEKSRLELEEKLAVRVQYDKDQEELARFRALAANTPPVEVANMDLNTAGKVEAVLSPAAPVAAPVQVQKPAPVQVTTQGNRFGYAPTLNTEAEVNVHDAIVHYLEKTIGLNADHATAVYNAIELGELPFVKIVK